MTKAKIIILGVWVFSVFVSVPYLFFTPKSGDICDMRVQLPPVAHKYIMFPLFGTPSAITFLLYTKIAHLSWKKRYQIITVGDLNTGNTSQKIHVNTQQSSMQFRNQLKITKMLGLVLGIYWGVR